MQTRSPPALSPTSRLARFSDGVGVGRGGGALGRVWPVGEPARPGRAHQFGLFEGGREAALSNEGDPWGTTSLAHKVAQPTAGGRGLPRFCSLSIEAGSGAASWLGYVVDETMRTLRHRPNFQRDSQERGPVQRHAAVRPVFEEGVT